MNANSSLKQIKESAKYCMDKISSEYEEVVSKWKFGRRCRQCGGELDVAKKCFQCKHPIQMICTECTELTEIRFHSQCMYQDEILSHTVAALA